MWNQNIFIYQYNYALKIPVLFQLDLVRPFHVRMEQHALQYQLAIAVHVHQGIQEPPVKQVRLSTIMQFNFVMCYPFNLECVEG